MNDGGRLLPLKCWWREPLNIHRLETLRRRERELTRSENAPRRVPLLFLTPRISSFVYRAIYVGDKNNLWLIQIPAAPFAFVF